MKNPISFLLFLIFICSTCYSQGLLPRANSVRTVADSRLQATLNLFTPRYADTTAANAGTSEGIDSCGALIFTYDIMNLWVRKCSPKRWEEVGGSSSPFLPVTGTGTATGAIIGSLDGNTLSIQQGGNSFLSIDPTANAESSTLQAYNTTDDDNISIFQAITTDVTTEVDISTFFNGGSTSAQIELEANASTSTIDFSAGRYSFLITGVPDFADDAAAIGGGLLSGNLYKTTTGGSTFLKIVP